MRPIPNPLVGLCAGALLIAAAPAARAQLELTRSGGTLGADLVYTLVGDPFGISLLLPSLQTGPTPLALLDPSDPRVLGVGIDVPALWSVGVHDGAGVRTVPFPLPSVVGLNGLVLFAQAIALPGATTAVGDISDRTAVALGAPNVSVATPFEAPAGWAGHSATLLADGRVLIAGGAASDALGASLPTDGLHLYDPQSGAFTTLAGTLATGRVAHTATRLADGRVLIVGGTGDLGTALASAEVVDPVAGTSTPTAALSEPRVAHTATLLADGRVFVAGGTQNFDFSDPLAGLLDVLASTRLWNPATGTWAAGPNLPARRIAHAATRLNDGRVLVSGGLIVNVFFGIPLPAISGDCRLYNPATNAFSSAAGVPGARAFHGQVILPDGRVLAAGGADGDVLTQVFNTRADTHVYNPANNTWIAFGALNAARAYVQLTVSGNGQRVVASGGVASIDLAAGGGAAATTTESAPLPGGTWTTIGAPLGLRPLAPAVAIDGGRRILTTGAAAPLDLSAETLVLY